MNTSRILAIDYGSKRVGVAVSDEGRQFATPVSVVRNTPTLVVEISKLAGEYGAREIVLGESKNYRNEPNAIMASILEFKAEMEKGGFTVHLESEFMSSVAAEEIQGKNDLSDASAAAIILQRYLDKVRAR
jgi:putative Holliday junction resolvase